MRRFAPSNFTPTVFQASPPRYPDDAKTFPQCNNFPHQREVVVAVLVLAAGRTQTTLANTNHGGADGPKQHVNQRHFSIRCWESKTVCCGGMCESTNGSKIQKRAILKTRDFKARSPNDKTRGPKPLRCLNPPALCTSTVSTVALKRVRFCKKRVRFLPNRVRFQTCRHQECTFSHTIRITTTQTPLNKRVRFSKNGSG